MADIGDRWSNLTLGSFGPSGIVIQEQLEASMIHKRFNFLMKDGFIPRVPNRPSYCVESHLPESIPLEDNVHLVVKETNNQSRLNNRDIPQRSCSVPYMVNLPAENEEMGCILSRFATKRTHVILLTQQIKSGKMTFHGVEVKEKISPQRGLEQATKASIMAQQGSH